MSMKYEVKWDDPNYVFEYDECAKCCLRWKRHKRHKSLVGKECGTKNKVHGHWCVQFRGSPKLAHRIIWEMFNGQMDVKDTIEFIDGDISNLRIDNLRIVKGEDKNWQDAHLRRGDLQSAFSYSDGMLYWKGDRYSGKGLNKKYASDGDPLDCAEDKDGYWRTCITAYDAVNYMLHRIIYEYFNGSIPEGMQIDHIDGNVKNNRIENLRCVHPAVNCRNRKIGNNKLGVLGVSARYDDEGNPKVYRAGWRDADGKSHSKSYACSVYGQKAAFDLAVAARQQGITDTNKVLRELGYHENHGKRA